MSAMTFDSPPSQVFSSTEATLFLVSTKRSAAHGGENAFPVAKLSLYSACSSRGKIAFGRWGSIFCDIWQMSQKYIIPICQTLSPPLTSMRSSWRDSGGSTKQRKVRRGFSFNPSRLNRRVKITWCFLTRNMSKKASTCQRSHSEHKIKVIKNISLFWKHLWR